MNTFLLFVLSYLFVGVGIFALDQRARVRSAASDWQWTLAWCLAYAVVWPNVIRDGDRRLFWAPNPAHRLACEIDGVLSFFVDLAEDLASVGRMIGRTARGAVLVLRGKQG